MGCEAWYVGRTTQRLANRIKQHVPTSISKKSNTVKAFQYVKRMLPLFRTNQSLLTALECIPENTQTWDDINSLYVKWIITAS